MAPLEPDATARNNTLPLALFSGQILLVAGLTTHVLTTARRAASSLPPSAATRSQQPARRRHATVFSVLALLSLLSVTTFAVMWRVVSYLDWAEKGNHETPGNLWAGWYGTGDEGVGRWRLGDWTSDVDLVRDTEALAVQRREGFVYTIQHFVGLLASAMFIGIEGHRRNLSTATIASFVVLGATGSLAYALCLFFITMLYTPLAVHGSGSSRRDALFTPKPAVYYVPIVMSLAALDYFPTLLAKNANVAGLRYGYVAVPLFLALAPRIIPSYWGHQHVSKESAHRAFTRPFYVLSIASIFITWKLLIGTFFVNTPREQHSVYDLLKNALGKHQHHSRSSRVLTGIGNTAYRLKLISQHPAVSITSADVLFTAISLLTWAFTRNLDVDALLENSILSFFASKRPEKHVAFERPHSERPHSERPHSERPHSAKTSDNLYLAYDIETVDSEEEEAPIPVITPKKRGRPKKNATTNGVAAASTSASASSTAALRRSSRRKIRSDYESEAEDSYEPTASARREVAQTETDGTSTTEDLVSSGESTALALCLAFAGGLGQLAATVLGAEVTGHDE
ncbi:hypothetical protein BDV95DRAFT_675511 [Massariosphaeria phaeospora]|uniref:Uncharacterized protein n=1 Tax=Massariosphaeria phaeospora TaxID=100035 RepID=A0A7C8ID51_9PLEO|nr:hypothetical protein BDV95DRAFT_675511 [Massariosphaeria phaeospora]